MSPQRPGARDDERSTRPSNGTGEIARCAGSWPRSRWRGGLRLQMAEGDHLAQPTSAKRLKPPHHTHRISAHVAQRALRLPTGGRFMRQYGWPSAPKGHLLHAPVRILVAVIQLRRGAVATSRRPGHPSTVRCSPGLSSLAAGHRSTCAYTRCRRRAGPAESVDVGPAKLPHGAYAETYAEGESVEGCGWVSLGNSQQPPKRKPSDATTT